jgi:hypothetical protein
MYLSRIKVMFQGLVFFRKYEKFDNYLKCPAYVKNTRVTNIIQRNKF